MKREKLRFSEGNRNDSIFKSIDNLLVNIKKQSFLFNPNNRQIVSLIFFVNPGICKFSEVSAYIQLKIENEFQFVPTYSVIGQPPADGTNILVEIEVIRETESITNISYYPIYQGINYTRIETPEYIEFDLFGITVADEDVPFDYKVFKAFEILDNFLINEGLGMNCIVRQWNYVENIVGFTSPECGSKQNYQILNNVRHEFYSKYNFSNGFPAATGIGMTWGGFILDCIVVKEKRNLQITPIQNPAQVSAYDYSENVLIGSKIEKAFPKLSPKFERAKLYNSGKNYTLLVSGTAAIHNEVSLAVGDAAKQTEITLDNIGKLIQVAENVIQETGKNIKEISFPYLRVYIKNSSDYLSVKDICENHTHQIDPVYLIGDICRTELLVEIEGIVNIEIA